MRRIFIALGWLLAMTGQILAQDRATLVADNVAVKSGSILEATGNVEVYFGGSRLTAAAIIYDQSSDQLKITGPIRIDDGTGAVLLADQAELSADLSAGLLTSARLVLNGKVQLAAAQVVRSESGNVTAMRRVAASACTICQGNSTPLWEIRAREVVHDAVAQQIFFNSASLRFYGLPVLYLPVLRVPDPTLDRARGFLFPKLRSTSALGLGIKAPYFIPVGDSRDVTLTPYLTFSGNRSLELRFREAFRNGMLTFSGAASRDTIRPGGTRGYGQISGVFSYGNDFNLDFRGTSVSDKGYLSDYGISDTDRIDNQINLTRIKRDLAFSANLTGYQSLREGENNNTIPTTISDVTYVQRFSPAFLGGTGSLILQSHSDFRRSTSVSDDNGDGIADGRDLDRLSAGLTWQRIWVSDQGMVLSAMTQGQMDAYRIIQDANFSGRPFRRSGQAGIELSWPWSKTGSTGVSHLLTPTAQLVTSAVETADIPNGDSNLVEFDEGNLFALDRYPGSDAVEDGRRLNLGISYLRTNAKGLAFGVTVGQVRRLDDVSTFSDLSGLSGKQSDWLVAWNLRDAEGLSLTNRLVLKDDLSLTKGELRFDYTQAKFAVSGGYQHVLADAAEDRAETTSEIMLNARRELTQNWSASLSNRYDLRAQRLAQAGLTLDFRNECIDVVLSLSRSYASSTSVTPSTDFGLSVELLGFGGSTSTGPSRVCRK